MWPRPPSAVLRPLHPLIHVLTDRPAFATVDGCHKLCQDNCVEFDLSDFQLTGKRALQGAELTMSELLSNRLIKARRAISRRGLCTR